MDAAELDFGPGVDGVGFWDNGTSEHNSWPGDYHDLFSGSTSEVPYKRLRNVPAETSGEEQDYGTRFDDGGHGGGSGNLAFTGLECGDSLNWGGAQGARIDRGNDGASVGTVFSGQPETRTINNFLGDFCSDTGPLTPNSSGAPGSPSTGRGRGTGSIFFKTKLCTKFRAGTCPYSSNCNFAHGMEELRKPPPGWEEIAAVQDAERGLRNKEISGQPILSSTGSGNSSDSQRFHKTRPCKKYYSDGGCPYGDRCNFLHDDQARERESNAISLGPAGSPSSGMGGSGGIGSERPPNWKTRLCNKWETTGHCPFGQKCHFAHGLTELQMHGGFHVDSKNGVTSGSGPRSETKQVGRTSKTDNGSSYLSAQYGADGHNTINISRHGVGVLSLQLKKQIVESKPNWKGPSDEISTIYGDWIEEDEWEQKPVLSNAAIDQPTGKFSPVQEFKEQSFQQLSMPLKGNVVSESGQRQNSQHRNFKRFKKGNWPMHVAHGDLGVCSEGEDGWVGDL